MNLVITSCYLISREIKKVSEKKRNQVKLDRKLQNAQKDCKLLNTV